MPRISNHKAPCNFHLQALVHWVAKKGQQEILVWLAQNNADLANKTVRTSSNIPLYA